MNEPASAPKDGFERRARGGDVIGALVVGGVYVSTTIWRDYISVVVFGVPATVSTGYLQTHSTLHQATALAIRLPAFLLALALIRYSRRGELRQSILGLSLPTACATVALTFLVSAGLNAANLWPFTWRWAGDNTLAYAKVLGMNDHGWAFTLWGITGVLITPLTEEVVFRFGLLRSLRSVARSDAVGILGSSILFAAGHLGYALSSPPDTAHLVNATWMLLFSTVLGVWVVRHEGKIAVPVVAHATRNALEWALIVRATGPW